MRRHDAGNGSGTVLTAQVVWFSTCAVTKVTDQRHSQNPPCALLRLLRIRILLIPLVGDSSECDVMTG